MWLLVSTFLLTTLLAEAKVPAMALTLLKDPAAVCLDGSPGGFYTFLNSSDTRWIVFLQGGGWCYTVAECLFRADTQLGSSSSWPHEMKDDEAPGLFDNDPSVNPFASFNKAYVNYCDGGSFSGNVVSPVHVGPKQIFFRGRAILESVAATLRRSFGMEYASEVLLSGCSAGGLSTYLHADAVGEMLPSSVRRYKAAPISGFFLDRNTVAGKSVYPTQMRNVFAFQNASVDADCIAARRGSSTASDCMFAEHVWPYISTPIFGTNSMYDSWSLENIYVVDGSWNTCLAHLDNCTAAQVVAMNSDWQTDFLQRFLTPKTLYAKNRSHNRNGCFLGSLVSHCEAGYVWNQLTIEGTTVAQAWWRWFNDLQSTSRYIGCTLRETAPFDCATWQKVQPAVTPSAADI